MEQDALRVSYTDYYKTHTHHERLHTHTKSKYVERAPQAMDDFIAGGGEIKVFPAGLCMKDRSLITDSFRQARYKARFKPGNKIGGLKR